MPSARAKLLSKPLSLISLPAAMPHDLGRAFFLPAPEAWICMLPDRFFELMKPAAAPLDGREGEELDAGVEEENDTGEPLAVDEAEE